MDTVVISLGGSLVAPEGVNTFFVQQFISLLRKTKKRFVIVVGGGKPAREYQTAAKDIGVSKQADLDWIGIMATRMNAELVRAAIGKDAHPVVITDPSKKLVSKKKVIVASGWKPGFSSDFDAVMLAKQLKAKTIINLTNTDYIYDKDPRKHSDAKQFLHMTWPQLQKIVGSSWTAGLSAPFDPIATKLAAKLKLTLIVANGQDLGNLEKIFLQRQYKGTTVS